MENNDNTNKELMDNEICLGEEQGKVYEKMEYTNDNLLITGKAGTGKTELLKYFKKNTKKKVILLSPTGIAALNAGGQTIHSLFRFDFGVQEKETINKEWFKHSNDMLKVVDTIILDEVSMIRPDIFEAVDLVMRNVRKCVLPFGGVQIICIGDLFQLPPVITDKEVYRCLKDIYGGTLFFNAPSFKEADFKIYELSHIYRQKESNFIDILNKIRVGNITLDILETLNKNVITSDNIDHTVTLTTTRAASDTINNRKLDELPGEEFIYTAKVEGNIDKSSYPADYEIHLKVGAQIIMLANDIDGRWVNGTLGIITDLSANSIQVKIDDIDYLIDKKTWKKYKYKYDAQSKSITQEIDGEFKQFPLKLAWAMTIHKSQSKTYKSVLVDLGSGAFETGQVYVALSRCTSLEKLYLKRPIKASDIKINTEVVDFMKNAKVLDLD